MTIDEFLEEVRKIPYHPMRVHENLRFVIPFNIYPLTGTIVCPMKALAHYKGLDDPRGEYMEGDRLGIAFHDVIDLILAADYQILHHLMEPKLVDELSQKRHSELRARLEAAMRL